ncbi:cytochrome c5 family protein, partial [Klebsiella pneumoniae]
KGGAVDLTDQELKRAITYMANKSGGSFPNPDEAAPADNAASGTASAPADSAAPAEAKAEDKGAAAPAVGVDGKKVFEATCQVCHGGSIPGIPGIG